MQLKTLFKSENFYRAIVFSGAVCALSSIFMGWGGVDFLIRIGIRKSQKLNPNTRLWNIWKTIPIPVYMEFYLFNITNAEELGKGAVPALVEMGPYTYLIDYDKAEFILDDTADTVKYKPSETYYFQPHLSKGSEEDLVTLINVVFLATAYIARSKVKSSFELEILDEMLTDRGEKLTRTDKIREIIFEGVSIQTYIDFINEPLVQQAWSGKLPENMQDGKFGLFKGKNGTLSDWWECNRGNKDTKELGKIHSYMGQPSLDIYAEERCNEIKGTDGSLNAPFLEAGKTELSVFVPQICRSITWEYVGLSKKDGIPVANYRLPDLQRANESNEAACYCSNKDSAECNIYGISPLDICFYGSPNFYSKPHFLNAEPSVVKMVQGLKPNAELHESFLQIHLLTGAVIAANIKSQISIELVPWEEMPSFANASRAFVPFLSMNQIANLEGDSKTVIRRLSSFLKVLSVLRWFGFFGSLIWILMGGVLIHRLRKETMGENPVEKIEADGQMKGMKGTFKKVWNRKFGKTFPEA